MLQKISNSNKLIPATLILVGIFLRLYDHKALVFGFDQVQILENVADIASGDMTLIGPRTGPADLFTGPLIYYLNLPFFVLTNSPYGLYITNTIIFIISIITAYILVKKLLLDEFIANTVIYFYAISPFVVSLDRVPWNPSLLMVASFLTVIPLIKMYSSQKSTKMDMFLIALGTFLGYQAHFSGLIFPIAITFIWIIFLRSNILVLISSYIGLLASLLPTFIFDLRNNFLNTLGMYNLIFTPNESSTSFFLSQIRSWSISLENIGKTILYQNTSLIIIFAGITIFGLACLQSYLSKNKRKDIYRIPLAWLTMFTIIIGVYQGTAPEYYYLATFPAIIIIFAQISKSISAQIRPVFSYSAFIASAYLILASIIFSPQDSGMGIGPHLQVQAFMTQIGQTGQISEIIFDLDASEIFGAQYLLSDLPTNASGAAYHIARSGPVGIHDYRVGNLSVWRDIRDDYHNYVFQKSLIIETPANMKLLIDPTPLNQFNGNQTYTIILDDEVVGRLIVVDNQTNKNFFDSLKSIIRSDSQISESGWTEFKFMENDYLALILENYILVTDHPTAAASISYYNYSK